MSPIIHAYKQWKYVSWVVEFLAVIISSVYHCLLSATRVYPSWNRQRSDQPKEPNGKGISYRN